MEYKYTGIVLNKKDIGEADRIYTFYTLEQGKIKAIARGVRRSQAKLAGHLENFCLVDFSVMKSKGMGNISFSVVEENFSQIKNSYEALNCIFETINFFGRLISDDEENPRIFSLLLMYLYAVNKDVEKYEIITQGFMFKLFDILGYGISTDFCIVCQNKVTSGANFFSYQHSGVVCCDCSGRMLNKTKISNNAIKLIRIFSGNNLGSLAKLQVSPNEILELKSLSAGFARWIT